MPVVTIPPTSNSTTHTSNQPPLTFSAADFQQWNQTTSVVHLPAKLVGKDKIPKVRGDIVKAISKKKVAAVQALSPTKYRVSTRFVHLPTVTQLTSIAFPSEGLR